MAKLTDVALKKAVYGALVSSDLRQMTLRKTLHAAAAILGCKAVALNPQKKYVRDCIALYLKENPQYLVDDDASDTRNEDDDSDDAMAPSGKEEDASDDAIEPAENFMARATAPPPGGTGFPSLARAAPSASSAVVPPATSSVAPSATSPAAPHVSSAAAAAVELDAADDLAGFRGRFLLPAPVYLCGHSLGAQPTAARAAVVHHLDKWAADGVDGHFRGGAAWATLEDTAARPGLAVVGAHPGEVVYMNSLTVNLHLLMTAFYVPDAAKGRVEVLIEERAFPSDDYAVQSHVRARGVDPGEAVVRVAPREGEDLLQEEDLVAVVRRRARRGTLALVLLPGVQYWTGQMLPMAALAKVCKEEGVPLGLDLAHAVGNVPLQLHDWGVDFAVWCSYKYLNSGPGAVGGAFVHSAHNANGAWLNRLGGWWGHDRETRFAMGPEFAPQPGAYGFQLSNPPVLALAPVAASLELFAEAGGVNALRRKSLLLTGFLEEGLCDARLAYAVEVVTPRDPEQRGNQLSIRLRRAKPTVHEVQARLRTRGIVCDVREPNVMRVAPAPLYNSFADIALFVDALADVLSKDSSVGSI
jgi:kynureninase